jgi:hypothetical protein
MTPGVQPTDGPGAVPDLLHFVPELRTDFVRRDVGDECVVWSSLSGEPAVLDPVATVMLAVVDGEASIGELATEVHEEIGIPFDAAQRQVSALVERFGRAGLLTSSLSGTTAEHAISQRELFVAPPTPCSESASRLGTETLVLRLGGHTVRVACDSRRAARTLRDALADHLVDGDEDAPLAFVLTAPQGFKRTHLLSDRAGFVLSEARGLEPGLHALASHLTALLPPAPGTVRFRTRAVVTGNGTVACLFPLLFSPVISERDLTRAGLRLVDRLALDVDVGTGAIANPEIPWPALRDLDPAPAHAGAGGRGVATAVVAAAPPYAAPPTRAAVVAELAAGGLHGSVAELLDAAVRLVEGAEIRAAEPAVAASLAEVLQELGSGEA